MSVISGLARRAPELTQATGVLLILLGIIHLIATPFLIGWSGRQVLPEHASLVIAGMRLNHILAGVLLIPLGISTFWSGKNLGQLWALRIAGMNTATLFCMPVLLVVIMPLEALDAPLFRLAIIVLITACAVQMLALLGTWRGRNDS